MPQLAAGFVLQEDPTILIARIPGRWLLSHTTPSWRLEDPETGFQRIVNKKRAIQIAKTVLDSKRTFPNAIVLATDRKNLPLDNAGIHLPDNIRFLVVDGQHRLWAQKFSDFEAAYACILHLGMSEQDMASLFVEINDNQKRVPSSLRWDLVRLVRPDEDANSVRSSDLVYELNENRKSPLHQRIDLTGEVPGLEIKQGSIAPEIRQLVAKAPLADYGFDIQAQVLFAFLSSVRDRDPNGWDNGKSNLYKNRVLRVLLRLIPLILDHSGTSPDVADTQLFSSYLKKLDPASLDPEKIKGQQGSAGMTQIADTVIDQIF